ncbi:MAG: hypothetical protein WBA44_00265 [Mesorhizobium sp.]
MLHIKIRQAALIAAATAALAGCTSSSSNIGTVKANTTAARLVVCHGFDCRRQTKLNLTNADASRFAAIMRGGAKSAAAERDAVRRAVSHFEKRGGQAIGVQDKPKSDITQSGLMGQMDCIDESTNTRTLMLYLQKRGLLKHHTVASNVSRGFFADGRYPHSTAVLQEKGGAKWAVDSWYEPMGGLPDVMPLAEWQRRGVMGER